MIDAPQFAGIGGVPFAALAGENRVLLESLSSFDALRLASTFGALLTIPELQSNCLRLEVLVHFSLFGAKGKRKPADRAIERAFSEIGDTWVGRLEDPAEDIFVTSIATPQGNFRILEGVWESGGFHSQRVVNVVETLPHLPQYDQIRNCVYALLRLSDAVCGRAGISRNELGNGTPVDSIPSKFLASIKSAYRKVRFSESDLKALGIQCEYLEPFVFPPASRGALLDEVLGHSSLEKRPIAYNGDYFFLLPTAASAALRRYVIDAVDELGVREAFVLSLSQEYQRLFMQTPLLGHHIGAPIEFRRTSDGLLAGVTRQFDHGLYLGLVFFVDTLEGFEVGGLVGSSPDPTELSVHLEQWIDHAYDAVREQPEYRGMITLLVGCGVGRIIVNSLSNKSRENWKCEFISAADLLTLSWLPDFDALSLWRILDAREKLEQIGVVLQNINGILNLVGWARHLEGHLVPHGSLPSEFWSELGPALMMIDQTSIKSVRHEAAVAWDPHVAMTVDGKWIEVRKEAQSFFDEDRNQPSFIDLGGIQSGHWRGVYESSSRLWWWELEVQRDAPIYWVHERSKMLRTWICRIVPAVERMLMNLPKHPLLIRYTFRGRLEGLELDNRRPAVTFGQAKEAIQVSSQPSAHTVEIAIEEAFEDALFHVENIAERALVERTLEAVQSLASPSTTLDVAELVDVIVPNASARQAHAFITRAFRDFVRNSVPASPVLIDDHDVALIKLGLGWRVRDRSLGREITSKQECTDYLNRVVRLLEDDLCDELRAVNRQALLMSALRNHESASNDRDNWQRTAAAVIALHDDTEATLQKIAEHDSQLNAVFLSTRVLMEFAICECPTKGGRKVGELDLSRLMAKVMQIMALGGWSGAIRWDAMEPHIRISPLGDIQATRTFREDVVIPFGRKGSDVRVQQSVQSYADNLQEPNVADGNAQTLPIEFEEAWQEEFGASFLEVRQFVDAVEDLGIKSRCAILKLPRSSLLSLKIGGQAIAVRSLTAIVTALTLEPRNTWRKIPEGYDERDRQPWRFRRRLSILRKPLLQVDQAEDPTLIVAPGVVRDAFVYTAANLLRGDFPAWQLGARMKRWAGHAKDKRGHEFAVDVATELGRLGWTTQINQKVTKLLKRGFEKDYGDVDVLAWQFKSRRLLVIECKDVQYLKTEGEIAEQLADFRGQLRSDGKPDLLLKHLLRVEVLEKHKEDLGRYVGLQGIFSLESHLVFKNPVPMQFAWKRMESRVSLHTFEQLNRI